MDFFALSNDNELRHHIETKTNLDTAYGNGCNANENKQINLKLQVPQFECEAPPTDCTNSKTIEVKYYIDVGGLTHFCVPFFP